jgi:hypothetical protein
MLDKFFKWTGLFESNLSAVEWAWRLLTIVVVAGGGTTAGLMARGTELFQAAGPIAWLVIGVCVAAAIAATFFLIKLGYRQSAEAAYLQALSQPRSMVNPLADSFSDQVIRLSDLYLPRRQVHSKKLFKRCKLVGPGAIALLRGNYVSNAFIEAGSPIVLTENATLTGVLVLEDCTVEDCEFIGITLLMNEDSGEKFKEMGAPVIGL